MKNALIAIVAVTGLAAAASAQQFTLAPGDLEFRIVADNTVVDASIPGDNVVRMALQTRYVGGNILVASLGATRGRIQSNEGLAAGVLDRSLVRSAPWGNTDFGTTTNRGMTAGHRELFAGGANNNNAAQNGGAAVGGEFTGANGNAGFQGLLAFDNASTGVGRPDTDGTLVSVGLVDSTDGGDGSFALEPDGGPEVSRWDSIFLFEYTVTDFSARTITFSYENIGSAAYQGVNEDTVQWFNATLGNWNGSNAALGNVVSGASITVIPVPAPGAVALLGLGGLVAGRRRRA